MTDIQGQFGLDECAEPDEKLPIWREVFSALELGLLHLAPVYWGLATPHGNGSGVVLIPGFLGSDVYLTELYAWLHRLDYRPYFSGIRVNAECPNLLITRTVNAVIDRARAESGKKVHLIGHSLGGVIAMSAAAQRPDDVASVITLGAPFRSCLSAHPNIVRMAAMVRRSIREFHGQNVLPNCYTERCTCNFADHLTRDLPSAVRLTAIYSRTDAVVQWRSCITGDSASDVEVPGTHLGLVFNSSAYAIIAKRLAEASEPPHDLAAPTSPSRTTRNLVALRDSRSNGKAPAELRPV